MTLGASYPGVATAFGPESGSGATATGRAAHDRSLPTLGRGRKALRTRRYDAASDIAANFDGADPPGSGRNTRCADHEQSYLPLATASSRAASRKSMSPSV